MYKCAETFFKDSDCAVLRNPLSENDTSSLLTIAFEHCGIEKCLPGHSFGPHIRSEFVIHFVLSGKGYLWNPLNHYEIGENQMFIMFPGEENTYTADMADPWYYCWIGFRGERADALMRAIGFSEKCPVLTVRNCECIDEEIRTLLKLNLPTPEDFFRRASHLNNIFALILENADSPLKKVSDPETNDLSYATYAIQYIQRHYKEKIYIAELASRIGISRSYLTQLVKDKIGLSPQEYLINYRLEHAAHFLRNTSDPVRFISMECGYEDSLAFSKAFKKKYGVSPSLYRREKSHAKLEA